MTNWYLKEGLVYRNGVFTQESVLIERGRLKAFGAEADALRAGFSGPILDFSAAGCLISRGFIDLHVHLREPGFEEKETIASGTQAAAAGGFTTVCAMPNTNPPLDTLERLTSLQKRLARSAAVKVLPIAAMTLGRLGRQPVDYSGFGDQGVRLFSDDGDPLANEVAWEVLQGVRSAGGIAVNHLEDKSLVQVGFFQEQIPPESEYLMLQRDLELVEKTGCRYHAAHLSCSQSVELIKIAKEKGLPVTAEVTVHHLTLTCEDIREPQGHFQMKPPLRTPAHQEALIDGLQTGIIDAIVTDHAPHGREKEKSLFPASPFGVTGLETAFPALYTKLILAGKLTLGRLLQSLTFCPAGLIGESPELIKGEKADLVVVDLNKQKRAGDSGYYSKGTNSPFTGQLLRGWPVLTLVDGKERYRCQL